MTRWRRAGLAEGAMFALGFLVGLAVGVLLTAGYFIYGFGP